MVSLRLMPRDAKFFDLLIDRWGEPARGCP